MSIRVVHNNALVRWQRIRSRRFAGASFPCCAPRCFRVPAVALLLVLVVVLLPLFLLCFRSLVQLNLVNRPTQQFLPRERARARLPVLVLHLVPEIRITVQVPRRYIDGKLPFIGVVHLMLRPVRGTDRPDIHILVGREPGGGRDDHLEYGSNREGSIRTRVVGVGGGKETDG